MTTVALIAFAGVLHYTRHVRQRARAMKAKEARE